MGGTGESVPPTEAELAFMDLERSHDEVDRWGIPSTETRETMCLSDRLMMARLAMIDEGETDETKADG